MDDNSLTCQSCGEYGEKNEDSGYECLQCGGTLAVSWEIPLLTPAEVNELASKIVRNEVYIALDDRHMDSFNSLMVFMPPMSKATIKNIAGMYSEYSHAGSYAVNGLPMFFDGKFLHKDNTEALFKRWKELEEILGIGREAHGSGDNRPVHSDVRSDADAVEHGVPVVTDDLQALSEDETEELDEDTDQG